MPTVYALIAPKQQWEDANGNPLSGYKLFVYTAGTTTKETTYQDAAGTTPNSNPIVLNSLGQCTAGLYTTTGLKKLVMAPPTDTDPPNSPLWTFDNIRAPNDISTTIDQWVLGTTPTYINSTQFSVVGDQRTTYQVGRRIQAAVTAGTVYGRISASAFASVTTVTVVLDSGALDSGLSAVSYGLLSADNNSVPLLTDAYPLRSGSADKTKLIRVEADGITTSTTRVWTAQDRNILVADIGDAHGSVRLTKSGANLLLSPFNGNTLIINSAIVLVPDAGVTLAPTALSINTTYYIYAYLSGSTLTLEASATGYASQAGTGIAIKSGDATRSLVGMARTITGPAWVDTATQRFVRNWFNDPGVNSVNVLTGNVLCTGTLVELNSAARAEFIVWAGEPLKVMVSGYAQQVAGAGEAFMNIGIDGTTAQEGRGGGSNYTLSAFVNCGTEFVSSGIAEGYHYATMLGTIGSNNANFIGSATPGARCAISVVTNGNGN